MKLLTYCKWSLIIVVLLSSCSITKTKHKTTLPQFNVTATKMNVLYLGVENPISVTSCAIYDSMSVAVTNGTIKRIDAENYLVLPKQTGKTIVNTAYLNNAGKWVAGGRFEFRTKRMPYATASFGGAHNKTLSINSIKNGKGVIARIMDFDYQIYCRIIDFSFQKFGNEPSELIYNEGGKIGNDVLEVLQTVQENDILIFSHINSKGPDGRTNQLDGFYIRVIGN